MTSRIVVSLSLVVLAGCSSSDGPANSGAGGVTGVGGAFVGASGGASSNGGGVSASGGQGVGTTGGFVGAGGVAAGGIVGAGGVVGVGGSGGASGGGGAIGNTGGAPATGGGGGGDTGPEPAVVAGCGGAMIYKAPDDEAAAGPWPVGVRTVQVTSGGAATPVEVWYPAVRGSQASKTKEAYDVSKWLWSDATKIPPAQNKLAECDCYRDLPIDTNHGPYPGVVFIHGTGSFRVASASMMTHWASRGFVVVAADHWGLYLSDFIACPGAPKGPAQDLNRDVDAILAAMTSKAGGFSFLGTSLDATRLAISGHSQGGGAASSMGNKANVQVVLPLSELGTAGVVTSATTKSAMFVCGKADSVTQFSSTQAGYAATTLPKKRMVGITAADHLDVTDLCVEKNSQGKYAIQVAQDNAVCGPVLALLAGLAHCGTMPDPTKGPAITNYVTGAALEETLLCQDRTAAFATLKTKFPEVSDFEQSP
jgi:predicted dienelactone hydrolase